MDSGYPQLSLAQVVAAEYSPQVIILQPSLNCALKIDYLSVGNGITAFDVRHVSIFIQLIFRGIKRPLGLFWRLAMAFHPCLRALERIDA